MDRDEKYKKIREHMDVKLRERKNKISVTASDQERMSLHPNYLQQCTKEELIKIILKNKHTILAKASEQPNQQIISKKQAKQ